MQVGQDEAEGYRLEVLVGEEAALDVEAEEAVVGEGDGLLGPEGVPEDVAPLQLDPCPDVGRQLVHEAEQSRDESINQISHWIDSKRRKGMQGRAEQRPVGRSALRGRRGGWASWWPCRSPREPARGD